MADLQRRSGARVSRSSREKRAFQYVVAGGALGTFGVVGLLLALFTSFGAGLPILALLLAGVCAVMFQKTTGQR